MKAKRRQTAVHLDEDALWVVLDRVNRPDVVWERFMPQYDTVHVSTVGDNWTVCGIRFTRVGQEERVKERYSFQRWAFADPSHKWDVDAINCKECNRVSTTAMIKQLVDLVRQTAKQPAIDWTKVTTNEFEAITRQVLGEPS